MAKKSADGPSKSQIIKDYFKTNPGAMPKDVVAGIKKESGDDVSIALVNNVKHNLKKGSKSKRRKSKTKAKGNEHGVKAQAIRDTLGRLGRKAKPAEVIAYLKGQGIVASYSQVFTIRKTLFKRGRKPGSKVAVASVAASSDSISMDHLIEAKKLAEKLGGIEAARHALSALAKLQ